MVSPRIWVGCAAGDDSQQGMALTQQLISDLQKAGAEVVSERVPLSDEQFLPLLQRELASCQWFILVQTPQGMGSRRVQLVLQEAHSFLKSGSLRGACLISVSSEGRGDSAPWPEIRLFARLYAYNGDYLRLRDKLLLDLGLIQITGMLQLDAKGDATVGTPPPVQQAPGFQPQAAASTEQPVLFQEALDFRPQASTSAEQPSPFQGHNENWYQPSPSWSQLSSLSGLPQTGSMASRRARKRGRGDRPVAAPLFIMPKPSRRFWVYSAVSLCIVALIISSAVLAKGMASAFTPSTQPTPITLTHSTPTQAVPGQPAPTQTDPTQPDPTQPAPGQPVPGQPAPTQPAPGQPAPTQPAPPTCPPQIGPGSTGTLVERAQSDLNAAYESGAFPNSPFNFQPASGTNTPLAVDGIFGTDTTNATKDFQTVFSPPVDGIIGPITWHALGEC